MDKVRFKKLDEMKTTLEAQAVSMGPSVEDARDIDQRVRAMKAMAERLAEVDGPIERQEALRMVSEEIGKIPGQQGRGMSDRVLTNLLTENVFDAPKT